MDHKIIDSFLEAQDVPGVVALITTPDEVIYRGAASVDAGAPFAIMSMTKPVTSVAIMMLQEQGRLNIDEPASRYLEKLRGHKVLVDPDLTAKTWREVAQEQEFTLRQLLNHTAGFGYKFCNDILYGLDPESELSFPLLHQPGTRWVYGVSTLVLGNIIEQVTGQSLGEALDALIFQPLGMTETSYALRDNQVHPHGWENGQWQAGSLYPEMPYGDGGLISTAEDYGKFLRCLLNGGNPILREDSLAEMTRNQIGDLFVQTQAAANPRFAHPFPTGSGVDKWGLGFQIHTAPEPGMRSAGSYSWCGLLNTYFWVDPTAQIAGVVMMQLLPLYEPRCLDTLNGFERLLYRQL